MSQNIFMNLTVGKLFIFEKICFLRTLTVSTKLLQNENQRNKDPKFYCHVLYATSIKLTETYFHTGP